MYPPRKTENQTIIQSSKPNVLLTTICLAFAFGGGMAFVTLKNSPETQTQILTTLERGKVTLLSWLEQAKNESIAVLENVSFIERQQPERELGEVDFFLSGPSIDAPRPFNRHRSDAPQPVLHGIPIQHDCGHWSTQRVARYSR